MKLAGLVKARRLGARLRFTNGVAVVLRVRLGREEVRTRSRVSLVMNLRHSL